MILEYTGVSKDGEKINGEFIGTKEELTRSLQGEGIFVLSVKESKRQRKKSRYTIEDFASEVEELSYLVSSGLQLDKSISTMIKTSKKNASVELWEDVLKKLKSGKQLSASVKESLHDKRISISDFYINIIAIGEEVGNLKKALLDVSNHLKFKLRIKREIISSLGYPIFLIFVSIVSIFFVAYFILPKFASIFTAKEFEQLPTLSKLFLGFGRYIHDNMSLVISVFFVFLTTVIFVASLEKPRKLMMQFLEQLPVIRDIALEFHIASLCSSLGAMIEGGIDLNKAMRLAAKVIDNKSLRNVVIQTANGLKRGAKISDIWSRYSLIPDDVVSLVVVGENSARLGDIFFELGDKHLDNFKVRIMRAMVFLEPAMIVLLGVFIGLIVVSIMLAVLSLTNVS